MIVAAKVAVENPDKLRKSIIVAIHVTSPSSAPSFHADSSRRGCEKWPNGHDDDDDDDDDAVCRNTSTIHWRRPFVRQRVVVRKNRRLAEVGSRATNNLHENEVPAFLPYL